MGIILDNLEKIDRFPVGRAFQTERSTGKIWIGYRVRNKPDRRTGISRSLGAL
jgi:hypothetical protein